MHSVRCKEETQWKRGMRAMVWVTIIGVLLLAGCTESKPHQPEIHIAEASPDAPPDYDVYCENGRMIFVELDNYTGIEKRMEPLEWIEDVHGIRWVCNRNEFVTIPWDG